MDPSSPSPPPNASIVSRLPAALPYPLTRPTSDSALSTVRSTSKRNASHKASSRGRRTRSVASSQTGSASGSDFGMEDYSIDLAKLGETDSSWTMGRAGERDIERVSSRDEGPEDFTLRMGDWMRGTLPWKKDPPPTDQYPSKDDVLDRGDSPVDPKLNASFGIGTEGHRGQHGEGVGQTLYGADNEEEIQPLSTSTPAPGLLQPSNKHSSAPPFSQMNTEVMQDRAAQEVFDQISALQVEVERLRLDNKEHLSAERFIQHANLKQQDECRVLRTQVDDLRSEVKRLQDSEFKTSQKALRLEQELKKDGPKVGSLRARFEPVVAELEAVKLKAEADKQAADSTINALKADLRSSNDVTAKLQAERSIASSTHGAAIENLRAEMKVELEASRTKYQHREDILKEQLQANEASLHSSKASKDTKATIKALEVELASTKQLLEEARRNNQNIEDENDLLVQESERHAEEVAGLRRALDEERLQVSSAADAEVEELQEEIARMQAQKTTDTISYAEHTTALGQLADNHAVATDALTAKHKQELHVLRTAIIKAGEGMKKREERITAAHRSEISDLQKQITTLQDRVKSATSRAPKPTIQDDEQNPTVIELRSALAALNSRLCTTLKQRDSALADAEKYHTLGRNAVAKAKDQISQLKGIAEAAHSEVDKRVKEKMEDREREWRRRIKLMFKEREQMGDALMAAWGREECGKAKEGERQKYRYRYFDKEGRYVDEGLW
ncbi:MAG: hypothetical protein LQ339_007493 [Xanthoria mediterranea]|nr:MAG: hypothetical protein LQ339_007493 [Xanthoria mediterranea]